MSTATDNIVLTANESAGGGVCMHHREFPEIHAEGTDARDAAGQLANHLTRALDSALTKWRRDAMETAIAEVRVFSDTSG